MKSCTATGLCNIGAVAFEWTRGLDYCREKATFLQWLSDYGWAAVLILSVNWKPAESTRGLFGQSALKLFFRGCRREGARD